LKFAGDGKKFCIIPVSRNVLKGESLVTLINKCDTVAMPRQEERSSRAGGPFPYLNVILTKLGQLPAIHAVSINTTAGYS
jgi:hypothetical protein